MTDYSPGTSVYLIYKPDAWSPSQVRQVKIAKVTPKGYRLEDGDFVNREFRGGNYIRLASPDDIAGEKLRQRKRQVRASIQQLERRIIQRRMTEEEIGNIEELIARLDEVVG